MHVAWRAAVAGARTASGAGLGGLDRSRDRIIPTTRLNPRDGPTRISSPISHQNTNRKQRAADSTVRLSNQWAHMSASKHPGLGFSFLGTNDPSTSTDSSPSLPIFAPAMPATTAPTHSIPPSHHSITGESNRQPNGGGRSGGDAGVCWCGALLGPNGRVGDDDGGPRIARRCDRRPFECTMALAQSHPPAVEQRAVKLWWMG